ncbi:ribbon-helix-helix protein, CopG family [Geomonas anaerohicana]|uniref:CopG family transcriptional regulator n=1 Tax=Geomonas anaerohicana TaxID=2798583 RepID=A0ABS0YJE9_9BACT|nr:ribbon-helix-helix protein, CopG family [Geomonas anaerohicana]MBJ6752454.1 CopG family transcriptional regulator [Geomonas anaerohicana]
MEQKQYMTQVKRKSSRKKKENREPVLKNVVSLRVSDQEKRLLERLTKATSLNVSDLVREAIGFWLTKGIRKGRIRGSSTGKIPMQPLQLAGN